MLRKQEESPTTTNQSTPALTPSSPLSLEMPRQRSFGSMVEHHHRNESCVTGSSGASPDTEEYMTPTSDLCPPSIDLTTTSDSGDEASRPACESRWSMGSSIAEEPEVAEDEEREKEDRKIPSKRRRLLSLISLLSPTTEKKEKELKTETPPSPTTAPSVYLESPIVSASTHSLNPPLLAPFDNNHYYDTSHSESSLPSHPVIKMGSLASLGYANRSLVKPKKRKLVVNGVGRDNVHAYEAVKDWCEVSFVVCPLFRYLCSRWVRALGKWGLSREKGMGRSTSTGVNRVSLRPFVGSGRGFLLMAPGAFNCRGIRESQRRRKKPKQNSKQQKLKCSITHIPLESLGFISYIASIHPLVVASPPV